MNVELVYFSQTGNTRRVADAMADALREMNHPTRIRPLEDTNPQDLGNCNLLGVGSACFSSHAPTVIKDFLRSLPTLDKINSFVFATSSGAPGKVLYDMTCYAKKERM